MAIEHPFNSVEKNEEDKANITLPLGDIQFYDNYLPALEASAKSYHIEAKPSLPGVIAENSPDVEKAEKYFIVAAPRFSLDSQDIHAMHPAPNSSGEFDTHLPHIVLNKKVLPWERRLNNDKTPWLALLLFTEDELVVDANTSVTDTKALSETVNTYLQPEKDTFKPALKVNATESSLSCFSIKMTAATFKKIVPHLKELNYLSHCRQVNTGDKEILGMKDEGWFSVIISNRFPKADKTPSSDANNSLKPIVNIIHVISLEGIEPYLTAESTLPTPYIRLLSLASWSFTCLPEKKENFGQLLSNIITQPQKFADGTHLLRLSSNDSALDTLPEVKDRLKKGYLPLLYHTRTGENTMGWYRGPFTPAQVETLPLLPHSARTSDGFIIYEEQNGLFDVSYATAWQLGRGVALADKTFTRHLMDFHSQQYNQTEVLLRRDCFLENKTSSISSIKGLFVHNLQQGLINNIGKITQGTFSKEVTTPEATVIPSLHFTAALSLEEREKRINTIVNSTLKDQMSIPEVIQEWLINLQLLHGIPFYYLVANPDLLPVESIRFFHIDNNWIDTLIDGALSIGLHSRRDIELNSVIKQKIKENLTLSKHIPATGLLLRSSVVSGWPGLAVRVNEESNNVKLLRMERLSPTVLLCLFDGIPQKVTISEPQEQLSFGVSGDNIDTGFIELRDLTAGKIGFPLDKSGKSTLPIGQFFRDAKTRVLQINSGTEKNNIINALTQQLKRQTDLTSSEFAIEMVRAPEEVCFNIKKPFM